MKEKVHGIYFEKDRNRFRVRLYKDGEVVHLSYHELFDDAVTTLRAARKEQANLPTVKSTTVSNPTLGNLLDVLNPA